MRSEKRVPLRLIMMHIIEVMAVLFTNRTGALSIIGKFSFEISSLA
jgi:hypothetical protein